MHLKFHKAALMKTAPKHNKEASKREKTPKDGNFFVCFAGGSAEKGKIWQNHQKGQNEWEGYPFDLDKLYNEAEKPSREKVIL